MSRGISFPLERTTSSKRYGSIRCSDDRSRYHFRTTGTAMSQQVFPVERMERSITAVGGRTGDAGGRCDRSRQRFSNRSLNHRSLFYARRAVDYLIANSMPSRSWSVWPRSSTTAHSRHPINLRHSSIHRSGPGDDVDGRSLTERPTRQAPG